MIFCINSGAVFNDHCFPGSCPCNFPRCSRNIPSVPSPQLMKRTHEAENSRIGSVGSGFSEEPSNPNIEKHIYIYIYIYYYVHHIYIYTFATICFFQMLVHHECLLCVCVAFIFTITIASYFKFKCQLNCVSSSFCRAKSKVSLAISITHEVVRIPLAHLVFWQSTLFFRDFLVKSV